MIRGHRKRGIAMIMALYVTAIVLVLATFFIADQLNKSRSLSDYKDSKMALEAANTGLNYLFNYMGDMKNHWADAILISDLNGNAVCPGAPVTVLWGPGQLTLAAGSQFSSGENDYTFSTSSFLVSSVTENKWAAVSGTLQIFYNKNLAPAGTCVVGATNPYAITNIKITVNAVISNLINNKFGPPIAARQIQWTGLRNVGLYAAIYQCWTCWDVPGGKYPNRTEGTDTASYIGNGYEADASVLALANISKTADRQTSPVNSFQSIYGINYNGVMQIDAADPSKTNGLPVPLMTGNALASNNISINNTSGNSWGIDGKSNSSANAEQFITGIPFGPASGGSQTTAPQVLLQDYNSAASDSGCSNSVKTVFTVSSMDVGYSTDTKGHDFEYYQDSKGNAHTLEPAVADVTLNNNGTFSVTKTGYYSGRVIGGEQYTKIPASSVQHGILYFAGFKNVRVHGQLQSSSLSIISDQGEAFYDQNGKDITPTTTANPNGTSCVASNLNLSGLSGANNIPFDPNSLKAAARYQSNLGEVTSTGHDYWIAGNSQKVYSAGSAPGCTSCLYDGIYYGGNGNVTGYHVDDTNGQPLTLSNLAYNQKAGAWQTTENSQSDINQFHSTVFAPPPTQTGAGGTFDQKTILVPSTVQLVDSTGNVLASKIVAPYPGASAMIDLQNNPSQTPDDLFYTRQFEQSEGNLTIAGDTGSQGQGNSLGLLARNYVILNDMVAGGGNNSDSKYAVGDYTLQVRANVVSTHKSMQWEGNLTPDQNPTFIKDSYVNGDYVGMNGQYQNGTTYTMSYYDLTGTLHSNVPADSWQGAPLLVPGTNGKIVSPLLNQPNPNNGLFWNFRMLGTIQAPYQDIVNSLGGNGTYVGYAKERLGIDKANLYGPPPGFPFWSFAEYQNLDIPAFYVTLSYSDLGAIHAYGP